MNEIRSFATVFVTDLVNRQIIAKEAGATWTLVQPILGYQADLTFHSKDEMIQKLTDAAVNQYGKQSGLRSA